MKTKALIYIILSGMLWGSSGLFVHFLSPFGFSSLQMTSIRAVVSAVVFAIYVFFYNRKLYKTNIKQIFMYFLSGFAIFATGAAYFVSIQASSVSTAVVLMYTAPVFVMIYSVLFLGEKLTFVKTLSVICMILGCSLVSGIIGGLKFSVYGILMGLVSGIAYSAYNIVTKIEMRHKCNPVSASMYCFIFMAIISLFFTKPMEFLNIAKQNVSCIPLMISCGIVTCVLPYFFYTLALKELPAGTASSLSIIEPLAATLYSVVLLNEKLDVFSILGFVLIVGAVFVLGKCKE